jgi:NAD(P)-dependent dehydrogenase (short-subunit alcohol dehydrogenase family)
MSNLTQHTAQASNMSGKYATLTNPVHKDSYAAISPTRPSLSQAGKTVVIAGGSSGIGYGIARAFADASASRIILLGRRAEAVAAAAEKLTGEAGPRYKGKVIGVSCDIGDAAAVDALWQKFHSDGIVVDVLVLNAAGFSPQKPLLEVGTEAIWQAYDTNVRAQMHMTERFYKQQGKGAADTKVRHRPLSHSSHLSENRILSRSKAYCGNIRTSSMSRLLPSIHLKVSGKIT